MHDVAASLLQSQRILPVVPRWSREHLPVVFWLGGPALNAMLRSQRGVA